MSNQRMTETEFQKMSDATPRWQKMDTLRKFAPEIADKYASCTDEELDRILYGIHMMITSPAFR